MIDKCPIEFDQLEKNNYLDQLQGIPMQDINQDISDGEEQIAAAPEPMTTHVSIIR
jgi:hypothetical protein